LWRRRGVCARPTPEIADFLAGSPTPEQILRFPPSARVKERAREFLAKSKTGGLSAEEQWELDQFEFAESLMQQVKARLRPRNRRKTRITGV
jgi:hypothetical protein